ncbi:MAG: lipopolysaccharide biosynthesis protein [Candidatus Saccharimonadaceae bacterium]
MNQIDSRKSGLVKNTFIIALGKMSMQAVSLLLLPLYTIYLSPAEYGTVDLILTYVVLFAPLVTLQIEMAAFRFMVDRRGNRQEMAQVMSTSVAFALPIIFGVFILAAISATLVNASSYIYLAILFIGVATMNNLFMQFARGMGDNKRFAFSSIVSGIVAIILNILFIVFLGMGAEGMLLAMLIANLLGALYLLFSLKLVSYLRLSYVDPKIRREMTQYSLPLVPNGVSWWVINAVDRTIISIILGLSANGIYAIAFKFPLIFTTLFSFFSLSWTESASMHINSNDRDKFFSDTANASLKVFSAIGLLIVAGTPLAFTLFIDSQFNEARMYVPILILGALFNAIVGIYSGIYVAKKLTRQVMNTSLVSAVINIGLTLLLIKYVGLYGTAFSSAVAFLVMAVYRHNDIKKYVTITYEKNLFIILALLYAVVITLYYVSNPITTTIAIVISSIASLILNRSAFSVLKTKVLNIAKKHKGTLQ